MISWTEHLPPGVDPGDVRLGAGSLVAAWRRRWADDPEKAVLVDPAGGTLTAAALDERSAVAAARLSAAGVGPGDRVVLSAGASFDHVVAYVGVLRLGAVALPLNGAYREPEVAHVVGDAQVAAAVTDVEERGRWITAAVPGAVVTPPDLSGLPPASGATPGTLDAATGGDPALLAYTSGTTGAPKGALLSHANLLASAEAVALAWRWSPDDRLVLALPLFHMHGLGVGLHGTLTTGATAVLHDRFDPGAVLDSIQDGASMFFGVPTMWHRLAAHPGADALARLRLGVSGSAPLPPDLHAAVADLAGRAPLERYGMTETAMLVSNPYDGDRRAGSVGFPLPGVEVRLAEANGEIEVRGPNVFAGYWRRPDATAESFNDGWFRTGDLGEVDPDGYLRIVGRAKELIISGGFNVYPREVEEVLRAHPAVDDAAVVGAPDPEWGERVCAFVVLADGNGDGDDLTDAALVAWCDERLASYKRPRRWERIDEVPRNALGKVVRHVLTERL
ncbi:MAG TPA: AMP-binding protein [Acidimicrobiales bacterium]|nr:AMP-binding protein [Acidimicrobiales bacterium]